MIGIIALLSAGRATRMVAGWRVSRGAQAFAEELQTAFALVGRNRKPVTISFDNTTMELKIADRSNVIYRRRNFGMTSSYKFNPSDLTFSSVTRSVEVYPPGLAGDSLSVEITRDGAYRRVRMLRGGMVQICSNRSSPTIPCQPA